MRRLVCVVEGDGEVVALPILIRRILSDFQVFDVEIARPFRTRRDRFLRNTDERTKMIKGAAAGHQSGDVVLVLLDADDDLICRLVENHLNGIRGLADPVDIGFVLATKEFEAWFIAGIESLRGFRRIREDATRPRDPESIRDAKGWIRAAMLAPAIYQATIDQAKLAAKFDWQMARKYSPSLDKLCRELSRLLDIPRLGEVTALPPASSALNH